MVAQILGMVEEHVASMLLITTMARIEETQWNVSKSVCLPARGEDK